MSTTLSNGYKLPSTGDKGSTFFLDLEHDIQRLNDHTHNGTDSSKISAKDMLKTSSTILAANWVSLGGGNYRQLITVPAGHLFDEVVPKFQISGGSEDGAIIHPSIEKASSTTYYIYINDNTVSVKVVYG